MSSTTSPGRRRMRAVASLCVRGLARGLTSLSFGKVVLGAAMVWMAVAFIWTGGHNSTQMDSTSARGDNTATVELASFVDQGSDGTDNNSGFSVPRFGGIVHTQPASSSAIPESSTNQNGQQFAPHTDSDIETVGPLSVKATDSGERADSNGHAVEAPRLEPRQTGSLADLLTGLFDRLAQAMGGGRSGTGSGSNTSSSNTSSSATSTDGGSSGGGTVSTQSSTQQDGQTAEAARDTTTTRSDADAGKGAKTVTDPQRNRQPSKMTCGLCGRPPPVRPAPPPHRVTCGLCGAPGPQPTPPSRPAQLDQLMNSIVDLTSGIVTSVAGKPAGDRTRQGLSEITGEVSDALGAAAKLNQTTGANGVGGTPATTPRSAMTGRVSKQADNPDPGPGLTGGDDPNQPDCASAIGCTDGQQTVTGRRPSALPARGPPTNALDPQQQDQNPNTEQGSASGQTGQASQTTLDSTQLHKIFGRAGQFTRDLIDTLTKHVGRPGHHDGSGDSNGPFVSSLLKLVGAGQQNGQSGTNSGTGSSSQSSGQSNPSDQINQLVNNFLTTLFNLLGINPQGSQSSTGNGSSGNSGSSSSSGGQSTGQSSLTDQIDQLTNQFLSSLFNLLGINPQSSQTGTGTGTGTGSGSNGGGSGSSSGGQNDPTNQIDQLTNQFLTTLFNLLGINPQGSQTSTGTGTGSGNSGSSGQSTGQSNLTDQIDQLTNQFLSSLFNLLGINPQGSQTSTGSGSGSGSGSGGQSSGQSNLTDQINQATNQFLTDLFNLLGINPQGGQSGGGTGSSSGGGSDHHHDCGDSNGGNNGDGGSSSGGSSGQSNLADQINQLTNQFLSSLFNLLGINPQGSQTGTGTGTGSSGNSGSGSSSGGQTSGQSNLTDQIDQATNDFLTTLFNLLGINPQGSQSGNGSGSSGGGSSSGGQNDPTNQIDQLTNDFLTGLFKLLGINPGQTGNSSNNGSTQQTGNNADPSQQINQLVNNFLTSLLNLLGINPQGSQSGTGTGSSGSGGQSSGQSSLTDQVNQATNQFLSSLFNLLGIGGQASTTGSQQTSAAGGTDPTQQINGLVNQFVNDLLNLIGTGQQGNQSGSGNGDTTGQDTNGPVLVSCGIPHCRITREPQPKPLPVQMASHFVTQLLNLLGINPQNSQTGNDNTGGMNSGAGSDNQSSSQDNPADTNTATTDNTATDAQRNRPPDQVTCGLCGRPLPQPTPPPHRVTCGLCGAPQPVRPAPPSRSDQLDQLMGGFVDLASGIVTSVAGKPAGDRTRQGLSSITDQVSDALGAASKLNQTSGASGIGGAPATTPRSGLTGRASKQANDPGPGLTGGDDPSQPDCTNATGCADDPQSFAGRQPSATLARGPPTNHQRNANQNTEQGSAPQASQTTLDTTQLHKIFGQAGEFTRDLIGGLSKLSKNSWQSGPWHRPGRASGSNDPTGKITKLTNTFESNLLDLLGIKQSGGGNNNGGSSDGGSHHHDHGCGNGGSSGQNNLTDKISQLTSNFVSSLLNLLGTGQQGNQTDTGSNGGSGSGSTDQSGGQSELASTIGQAVNQFVADLLQLVGVTGSNSTNGSQQAGTGTSTSTGQGLDQQISGLVNQFVTDLLQLVGGGSSSGGQSSGNSGGSGSNSNDQSTGQNNLADTIDQATNDFLTSLFNLLGINPQGSQSGTGSNSGTQQTNNNTTDPSQQINQLVNNFLTDLFNLLGINPQGSQTSTGSGSSGGGSSSGGQNDPTNQIDQLTNDFLTGLFKLLGINPGQTGTNTGSADAGSTLQGVTGQVTGGCVVGGCRVQPLPQPTPPSTTQPPTTQPVDQLVNNFLTSLLNLLGIGGQSGNQSGGQNGLINTNGQPTIGFPSNPPGLGNGTGSVTASGLAPNNTGDSQVLRVLDERSRLMGDQAALAREKPLVAAGKLSAATYRQRAAELQARQRTVDANAAKLDPTDRALVNQVTSGQLRLSRTRTSLAAQLKQVQAGTLRNATYQRRVAAYRADQQRVFQATEQLRDVVGGSAPDRPVPNQSGSGATCGSSGPITECDVVTALADGSPQYDRCIGLVGVNTCGAQTGSAANKALGHCTWQGCAAGTTTGENTAMARCARGDGCLDWSRSDLVAAVAGCRTDTGCLTTGRTSARDGRTARGSGRCTITDGNCQAGTTAGARPATLAWLPGGTDSTGATYRTVFAQVSTQLSCTVESCTGNAGTDTSGSARVGTKATRDSKGAGRCSAHGAGGSCSSAGDSEVAYRDQPTGGQPTQGRPTAGPVSTSHVDAHVACAGYGRVCGGTASGSTSARDTAVSAHWRGTSASTDCVVRGGGCAGQAGSDASSANDFARVDPATGRLTSGPSSTSTSSASINCLTSTCSGTVHTSSAAWDGAIDNGRPRISNGSASCQAGGGTCLVGSTSTASTEPGATLALSGGAQVDPVRFVAGPSAASAAGAALSCAGESRCTGTARSAATASDPSVSADERGSRSEGSCQNATGPCQAVTNSGSSSSPNADSIAPLVKAPATDNAVITRTSIGGASDPNGSSPTGQPGQQQQPATPTAPGSSANSGAPTVTGASSWTSVSATLNCGAFGSCTGTVHSSAAGSNGPNVLNGAGAARGPPASGTSSSHGRCVSTDSGCQAQTSSTAGSGQVVADILAEQNDTTATQATQQAEQARQRADQAARTAAAPAATAKQKKAAEQAAKTANQAQRAARKAAELAKKPVTDAPATLTQSSTTAQCASSGCKATTDGDTAGTPGRSNTGATCTAAATGCTVSSDASATTGRDSGHTTTGKSKSKGKKAKPTPIPGTSGSAQADSSIDCPQAGCTGTLTGNARTTAGPKGRDSTSTATGRTRCDGTTKCQAQITAGSSVAASARTVAPALRFAATSASVTATCGNGTKPGCATRTSTATKTTGTPAHTARHRIHQNATASCAAAGGCQSTTSGFAAPDLAQAAADCAGTGCHARTDGAATVASPGSRNLARSSAGCMAGAHGCAVAGQVGATSRGAQASASCSGTGARCRYAYWARSGGRSTAPGASAQAAALGFGSGRKAGGGSVATAAATAAARGAATSWSSCQGGKGAHCSYTYLSYSSAHSNAPGQSANAAALGHAMVYRSGAGGATATAAAQTTDQAAMAAASCQGSKGSTCAYWYRAQSSASGPGASANATGHREGHFGGGQVTTTAAAAGDATSAQASASCTGTAGTSCGYHYEASRSASASAPSGSYAWARASGSGGGGMGGGGVSVSASAYAQGNQAQASASCSGAANCSAPFFAKAVDSASGANFQPTWNQRGGHWDATHWGECSGTNGGCAVTAHAVPGPDGGQTGGWAECGGDCANFSEGGTNSRIANIPSGKEQYVAAGGKIDPKTGRPLVPKLSKNRYGADFGCVRSGTCTVQYRNLGDKGYSKFSCKEANCPGELAKHAKNGQTLTTGRNGDLQVSTPTKPCPDGTCGKGTRYDTATDPSGAGSYRDVKGRGTGWVDTTGTLSDGYSGSYTTSKGGGRTTAHYGDESGNRFMVACPNGCRGELKGGTKTDHFDIGGKHGFTGADAWLAARDKLNHPAQASWNGPGYFKSAEGVVMRTNGDGPPKVVGARRHTPNSASVLTAGTGNPHGRYEMYGQTGSVKLADGRTIENSPGRKPTAYDEIVAVTPDAKGRGGSLDCYGMCTETVPGNPKSVPKNCVLICDASVLGHHEGTLDPRKRQCTAVCAMHDELPGNPGSKTPNGYLSVHMIGTGAVVSFTRQGDAQYYLGKGGGFVQGYRDAKGRGGFAYCYGAGTCAGETTAPDGKRNYLECVQASCKPTVLLYPNPKGTDLDTYGPNDGWYCGKDATASGCISNDRKHMTMGRGVPQPSWMALFDPSYLRPATDTPVDRQLAEDLARFGFKQGDPLPPLNQAGIDALKQYDKQNGTDWADRYRRSLRPLTPVEKAFTAARASAAESDAQYIKNQGNKELPGLREILDKIQKTGSEEKLSPGQQKLLATAKKRFPLLEVDRGIIGGLDNIQYQQPYIGAHARGTGASIKNPKTVNKEIQKGQGVDAHAQPRSPSESYSETAEQRQLALESGHDEVRGETALQVQAIAASVAQTSLVGRQDGLRKRTNTWNERNHSYESYKQRGRDLEKWGNTLGAEREELKRKESDGTATQADVDRYNAEVKRYNTALNPYKAATDQLSKLNTDTKKINEVGQLLEGQSKSDSNLEFLRPDDGKIARGNGEKSMAHQLEAWDRFEKNARDVTEGLSKKGSQSVADDVKMLRQTAALNYDTVLRDIGSRKPDTKLVAYALKLDKNGQPEPDKSNLELIQLPSTGRSDMIYVLNSVVNSPGYKKAKWFKGYSEDDIANLASQATAKEQEGQLAALRAPRDSNELDKLLKNDKKARGAIKEIAGKHGQVAVVTVYVDPKDSGKKGQIVLFRVTDSQGHAELVDTTGKVYGDLSNYQHNNNLPDDLKLILPKNLMTAKVGAPGTLEEVDAHKDSTVQKVGGWLESHAGVLKYTLLPVMPFMAPAAYLAGRIPGNWDANALHAVASVPRAFVNLVGAGVTELSYRYMGTPEQHVGETGRDYFARVHPLTDMLVVTPAIDTARRWGPVILHKDYSVVWNGDPEHGVVGYRDNPLGALMEDAAIPSLALGAARFITAEAAGARVAAESLTAGEAASGATRWLSLASDVVNFPYRVVTAPYRLAGRGLLAIGERVVLRPVARLADAGARAAGYRAIADNLAGRPVPRLLWTASDGLARTSEALARGAELAGTIARYGLARSLGLTGAYRRLLGARPPRGYRATYQELTAAHQAKVSELARQQADRTTPDPVLTARRRALDSSLERVQEALGAPTSTTVMPTTRPATPTAIASGRGLDTRDPLRAPTINIVNRPAYDVLSDVLRRGRAATVEQIAKHTGLTERQVREGVETAPADARGGAPFRLVKDEAGDTYVESGSVRAGHVASPSAHVWRIVWDLGRGNRGGRIMTSKDGMDGPRRQGVEVPNETVPRNAVDDTTGVDYVGTPGVGDIIRGGWGNSGGRHSPSAPTGPDPAPVTNPDHMRVGGGGSDDNGTPASDRRPGGDQSTFGGFGQAEIATAPAVPDNPLENAPKNGPPDQPTATGLTSGEEVAPRTPWGHRIADGAKNAAVAVVATMVMAFGSGVMSDASLVHEQPRPAGIEHAVSEHADGIPGHGTPNASEHDTVGRHGGSNDQLGSANSKTGPGNIEDGPDTRTNDPAPPVLVVSPMVAIPFTDPKEIAPGGGALISANHGGGDANPRPATMGRIWFRVWSALDRGYKVRIGADPVTGLTVLTVKRRWFGTGPGGGRITTAWRKSHQQAAELHKENQRRAKAHAQEVKEYTIADSQARADAARKQAGAIDGRIAAMPAPAPIRMATNASPRQRRAVVKAIKLIDWLRKQGLPEPVLRQLGDLVNASRRRGSALGAGAVLELRDLLRAMNPREKRAAAALVEKFSQRHGLRWDEPTRQALRGALAEAGKHANDAPSNIWRRNPWSGRWTRNAAVGLRWTTRTPAAAMFTAATIGAAGGLALGGLSAGTAALLPGTLAVALAAAGLPTSYSPRQARAPPPVAAPSAGAAGLFHGVRADGALATSPLDAAAERTVAAAFVGMRGPGRRNTTGELPGSITIVPSDELLAAGLDGDLLEQVIAYTYNGRIHMTEEMVEKIRQHIAAGRLHPDWVGRAIDHEVRFHGPSTRNRPAREHEAHRAAVAAGLVLAQLWLDRTSVPEVRRLPNARPPATLVDELRGVAEGKLSAPADANDPAAQTIFEHSLRFPAEMMNPTIWVVRGDGSLWVGLPRASHALLANYGRHPDDPVVTEQGGDPVIAAGEFATVLRDGRLVGAGINARSGHYTEHARINPDDDPWILAVGRAAFARHGISFPAEHSLAGQPILAALAFPSQRDPLFDHHDTVATASSHTNGASGFLSWRYLGRGLVLVVGALSLWLYGASGKGAVARAETVRAGPGHVDTGWTAQEALRLGMGAAVVIAGVVLAIRALAGAKTIRAPTWLTGWPRPLGSVARVVGRVAARAVAVGGVTLFAAVVLGLGPGGGPATSSAWAAPVSAHTGQDTPVMGARVAFTAADGDTAGSVSRALGVGFAEFNAANDHRFAGPGDSIAGLTVFAPRTWTGLWVTLPGDSYWRIYVDRFGDLAGWERAVARDNTPNLIYPGDTYRIRQPPPAKPRSGKPPTGKSKSGAPKQGKTKTNKTKTNGPRTQASPPGTPWVALLTFGLGTALVLARIVIAVRSALRDRRLRRVRALARTETVAALREAARRWWDARARTGTEPRLWVSWLVEQVRGELTADELYVEVGKALRLAPSEAESIALGSRDSPVPPVNWHNFEFRNARILLTEVAGLVDRLHENLAAKSAEFEAVGTAVEDLVRDEVEQASRAGVSDHEIADALGVAVVGLVNSITNAPLASPEPETPPESDTAPGTTAGPTTDHQAPAGRPDGPRTYVGGRPGGLRVLRWLRREINLAVASLSPTAERVRRARGDRAAALVDYDARLGWINWAAERLRAHDLDDAAMAGMLAPALGVPADQVRAALLERLVTSAPTRGPPGVRDGLGPEELVEALRAATEERRRRLAEVNAALTDAEAAHAEKLASYRDTMKARAITAHGLGASVAAIARVMGWTVDDVRKALGDDAAEPDKTHRLWWTDRVLVPMLLMGTREPADRSGEADAVSDWIQTMVGRPIPRRKFWDSHLHHIGYPYQRFVDLAGFAEMMLADGHDGVYTLHPIPQRIRGIAYYGEIDAITGARFGQQMLGMRGKLTDAQLFTAHRWIPAHLRWHLVPGLSGGRFDVPGIGGYFQAMLVLNPGQAYLIAESTLHKENVTVQLGVQGGHILDPHYQPTLARLEQLARRLREALHDGGPDRDELADLAALLDGVTPGNAIQRLEELGRHPQLAEAMLRLGMNREDLGLYRIKHVHSAGLREALESLTRTGQLQVIHNDAGEPETRTTDGHTNASPPDRRYLNALLAALRKHPDARVIQAHVGTGKFTTLSVDYLRFLERTVLLPQRHNGAFPNLHFDVSWNDLAQHIKADAEITELFIRLVGEYPDRFIVGTDGIKPVNPTHYLRYLIEMEPVFAEIERRYGTETVEKPLWGNLRRLLGEAYRDTTVWAEMNIRSHAWKGVLDKLDPTDARRIREWADTALLYLPRSQLAEARAPEVVPPDDGNQQVADLLRWHNRVTPRTTKGSNRGLRGLGARTAVSDARQRWNNPSRAATAPAPARTPLDGVLGLRDPDGKPLTWEALISGDQARRAGLPDHEQDQARRLTQKRQLINNRNRTRVVADAHRALRRFRIWAGAATVLAMTAAAALISGPSALLAWISSTAFTARARHAEPHRRYLLDPSHARVGGRTWPGHSEKIVVAVREGQALRPLLRHHRHRGPGTAAQSDPPGGDRHQAAARAAGQGRR